MTRNELEKWSRSLVESAFAVDPFHAEEIVRAVLGRDVFVWSNLTCDELRALARGCFATARLGGVS